MKQLTTNERASYTNLPYINNLVDNEVIKLDHLLIKIIARLDASQYPNQAKDIKVYYVIKCKDLGSSLTPQERVVYQMTIYNNGHIKKLFSLNTKVQVSII